VAEEKEEDDEEAGLARVVDLREDDGGDRPGHDDHLRCSGCCSA
jgi:hypothetical protein